ncbi:MAG: 4-alpha-glucanotransferase [Planctomycetota bacterium]|nr:MAG: 4-alpha-glucanotransferase [Planctomycetota bacterium]
MARRFTLDQRGAGVLLHVTSLPGRHGSGDLGPAALRFVEFLASAGMRWWQTLPIHPIGAGDSPYSSWSAFAGDPLLISLDLLRDEGLLTREDVAPQRGFSDRQVRYARTIPYRYERLRRAYVAFTRDAGAAERRAFSRFCTRQREWLDDFALFSALKSRYRQRAWTRWPREVRLSNRQTLLRIRDELADEIRYAQFLQYQFARQWSALREACEARGVGLVGDLPIFVSLDSADVWARRELFRLDASGRPVVVSGCPPDAFAKTGQLWGHPHYAWPRHQAEGFAWWIARFRRVASLFHATRIDHFLGFHRCWTVPGRAKNAIRGTWTLTPGHALFRTVRRRLGRLEIVAEDLGIVTPEATALREKFGFPGMRVLQQGFGEHSRYDQPHNWPRNCVAYTGTHDTDTTVGWFERLRRSRRRGADGLTVFERAKRYLHSSGRAIHWDMVRTLYASVANTVIVPMQDLLGLGTEARMNVPATPRGNWRWRMRRGAAGARLARRLRELGRTYERCE